ncbi:(Lyso)-N-acylphosphatidylethanolamine lipase-like isoform X2 [Anguilla rostrata]|uniref:(Lyso)-N-acylphosphatidylethanolamine lipase-like isoform X2 n=1 Tax=Anguilla rostrata TaxID=7938 RepID=UPI0030D31175
MSSKDEMQEHNDTGSGWWWWPSWRPTSTSLLKTTEARILACVKNDVWARFVTLPTQDKIWTVTVTSRRSRKPDGTDLPTPLVMVHGFGGGVALWVRNLDALCLSRPVLTFDLLGFGRSSRPHFPSDPALAEDQWVRSIEQWRQAVGVERMILLGHSLGGYLATSYAIQYPERVSHLILVDPWGFPEQPQAGGEGSEGQRSEVVKRPPLSAWVKAVTSVLSFFNPLAAVRVAGPWVNSQITHSECSLPFPIGPGLVNRFRLDFRSKFEDLFEDDTVTRYIYHCNAQSPSGEVAFRAMSEALTWAKRPMLGRVGQLPPRLPLSLLYGGRSWIDSSTGKRVELLRPQGHTHIQVIDDASHNVYADQPDVFNRASTST